MYSPTWKTHIPGDMCFPTWETHIPSDMYSPTWKTHIPGDICVPPTRETNIPSDMRSPTWETHIPDDMCSPTWETHIPCYVFPTRGITSKQLTVKQESMLGPVLFLCSSTICPSTSKSQLWTFMQMTPPYR